MRSDTLLFAASLVIFGLPLAALIVASLLEPLRRIGPAPVPAAEPLCLRRAKAIRREAGFVSRT